MLIILVFLFISLSLSIWLAFYKPCLFLTPNDLFAMRHLGKKIAVCKKTIYFRERKTCLLLLSARKRLNLRFPTLLSFSISLTGPIPLRIQFLLLLPKKKKIPFFSLLRSSLSFSICTRATLSLFLFLCSLLNFAKKEKLMMWLSHSMICFALFCYRVSFCQLVVDYSFLFTL